jgi:hypothetical protein
MMSIDAVPMTRRIIRLMTTFFVIVKRISLYLYRYIWGA